MHTRTVYTYVTRERRDSDARWRRWSGTTKCSKITGGSWRGGGRALFVALIDAILRGRTALFRAATQPPEQPSIPKYPGWLSATSVKYFSMSPMSQSADDTRFLAKRDVHTLSYVTATSCPHSNFLVHVPCIFFARYVLVYIKIAILFVRSFGTD